MYFCVLILENRKKMETIIKPHSKKAVGRLTERQIKRRVGEAWALLENPEYSEKQVLLSAELLYYNADKVKVHEEARKYKKGHFAVFYYGTPDPNVIYLL
jgi:hypothetical protein